MKIIRSYIDNIGKAQPGNIKTRTFRQKRTCRPAGQHIEVCPFCGANLKAGEGDVVLIKADEGWWAIHGFLKGEG